MVADGTLSFQCPEGQVPLSNQLSDMVADGTLPGGVSMPRRAGTSF